MKTPSGWHRKIILSACVISWISHPFQFIFLSCLTLLFPLSFLPALLSFFLMSTKSLGLSRIPLGLAQHWWPLGLMRNRAAYSWSRPCCNYWQISYVYNCCLGLFLVFLLNGPYCAWLISYWFEHLHSKLQFCNLEERTLMCLFASFCSWRLPFKKDTVDKSLKKHAEYSIILLPRLNVTKAN